MDTFKIVSILFKLAVGLLNYYKSKNELTTDQYEEMQSVAISITELNDIKASAKQHTDSMSESDVDDFFKRGSNHD